jgi:hypothetical protein
MVARSLASSALLFVVSAACSGGGSSAQPVAETTTGSVYVAIDTATGTGEAVQFLVVGALLERTDGRTTDNLLAEARPVTFTDPSGELVGLALRRVPTGEYGVLHLLLAPDSGTVQYADGTVAPLRASPDLAIPIADDIEHDAAAITWLAVGHNLGETVVATPTGLEWHPLLAGRLDDSAQTLDGLQFLHAGADEVLAAWPTADGAVLHVEFSPSCAFTDTEDSAVVSRDQFVRRLGADDDLRVEGVLQRDGRLIAAQARASRHSDFPRLIGRITELRAATASFVLHVQAETQRGDRRLALPRDVLVQTANAVMHRPNAWLLLTLADLAVGDLAVVRIASRTALPDGTVMIDASDIEVPRGPGESLRPEWQGRVTAVDTVQAQLTVEPRDGAPIVIEGAEVPVATVAVDANTVLVRRDRFGPGRHAIELADVVANVDCIWWRGTVLGPATALATWVGVREP